MSVSVNLHTVQDSGHLAGLQRARCLRLCLLDGFRLALGNDVIPLPMTAQRVLAFLAMARRPVRRASLGGTLWPDTRDERAQANLRSTLWRLHRDGLHLVIARGDFLTLAGHVSVDVTEMTEAAHRLLDPTGKTDEAADPAVFRGDLLPDWGDEWVLVERERLRQVRLHALETACLQFQRAGRFGEAVTAGITAVIGEPLRESAQRALISAYLAEGNHHEALRQFDAFRERLHRELGLEPSPQLRSLMATAVIRR